MVKFPLPSS